MATDLMEYLEGRECKGFVPRPHYFQDGDFVSYFIRDDRAYEGRIDELLTVYRSMKTRELVGCKIKGVRRILRTLGDFGVIVGDGNVMLGMLFLAAIVVKPERREDYQKYSNQFGKAALDPKEVEKALAA